MIAAIAWPVLPRQSRTGSTPVIRTARNLSINASAPQASVVAMGRATHAYRVTQAESESRSAPLLAADTEDDRLFSDGPQLVACAINHSRANLVIATWDTPQLQHNHARPALAVELKHAAAIVIS